MTQLQRDVLSVLKKYGPVSNAFVARRLKMSLHQTYKVVCELTNQGLARHPKKQGWDITQEGMRCLEEIQTTGLRIFHDQKGDV